MQSTYDYWDYVIKSAYKTSLENFLKLLDVLYGYYRSTMLEGQGDAIEDFRGFLNEIALDEVIKEVDEDREIWKKIEGRLA
jgi:hypothetical protein